MEHLEIEYKTLLTKDEYKRLSFQFSHVSPVIQTNYYFDSENFDLKSHRMSLRIRTFADRAEMTLKIPKEVGNLEHNLDMELEQAKDIIKSGQLPDNTITRLIQDNGVNPSSVRCFGFLTTTRRETQTAIGLMALDSNQYANTKDFELELEVTDPEKGKKDFEQFLAANKISFKYAKSKVARFSATLKQF